MGHEDPWISMGSAPSPHPLCHASGHLVEFLILQHSPRARAKRRAALEPVLSGTAPAQQLARVLQEIDALHLGNRTRTSRGCAYCIYMHLLHYLSISCISIYISLSLSIYIYIKTGVCMDVCVCVLYGGRILSIILDSIQTVCSIQRCSSYAIQTICLSCLLLSCRRGTSRRVVGYRVALCCLLSFVVYLSFYPSICFSIRLSVYLSISLSVYLSICLSVCLPVCLPACLSVCLSVPPSIHPDSHPSIHLFYLRVFLSTLFIFA